MPSFEGIICIIIFLGIIYWVLTKDKDNERFI